LTAAKRAAIEAGSETSVRHDQGAWRRRLPKCGGFIEHAAPPPGQHDCKARLQHGEPEALASFGAPGADAPLQRAADASTDLGMTAPDLVENGDRPQAWNALPATLSHPARRS